MKKRILFTVLAVALVLTMCFGLAACSKAVNVKVIDHLLTEEDYAYALKKGNTALVNSTNDLIAEIKANGKFEEIVGKYFNGEESKYNLVTSATEDKGKNQLIVATNAAFPPFEYKEGNKFAGVDIEIAKMLADKLGKELVIKDIDFDAVVTSISAGLADIGMAGLTVNEERLKVVDFTSSYYKSAQVLVVKESDTRFDACKSGAEVEEVLKTISGGKAGYQSGTTGQFYIKGDVDWGYDGFSNFSFQHYTNGGLAIKDLQNSKLDVVVIDRMPAILIAKSYNK